MYTNMVLHRHWSRLACLCRYSTAVEGQRLPETAKPIDGISPPPRIPRGPTDILQALASTVGHDPTASHYKYHDDPYLMPTSNYRKRAFALSAEAGRKAAAWIRDEHAEWFTTRVWDPPGRKITPHSNAEPEIPAFAPKTIYKEDSKVTEEDLAYTIKNALIEDSIKVYQLLGGTQNISEELKMGLLQLLCFYNEKEAESIEWMEERWFAASNREKQSASWKQGGLAERIFTSMEPKTPEAYCTIIQGMAKFYKADRAHQLAQEAIEKGITLSTPVYNSLLSCIGFLYSGVALRLEQLDSVLRQMIEQQGLTPNIHTLSACLRSISSWGGGRQLQQKALDLLADFKQIGIVPGLSTYYYLLCLFCKERGPRHNILTSILSDLEQRTELVAEAPTDTNFFITAMAVCNEHLEDALLADRVHRLLMKDNNYSLVGDAYKESIYYRHLVTVSCKRAPLEKTLQLLDVLIPNIYIPEPTVMQRIIETLEVGGLGDRLAQVWSQLVMFGMAQRQNLVEKLLEAMNNCYQFQDPEVKQKMRNAVLDVLKTEKQVEEEMKMKDIRTPLKQLSASALCNVIEICTSDITKDDECWTWVNEALNRVKSGAASGTPARPETLKALASTAASAGYHSIASEAVSCLSEYGFEEASAASVEVLSVMLNRSHQEILDLLKKPRTELAANLTPSAMSLADAYISNEGSFKKAQRSTTDSSSGSDSDSSDDERNK